ncbi:hypothetical protein V1Y59_21990 [Gordonia sp. PKS22-38]|uniref:DUF222 domain-containing protein n=1 Tax=Gordonia prachuapensis TaxID=3115651 RepID=A0ABU7MZK9_9ACTN|nr:hypothetical protein [Gordonia sp. PKS22-38]
MFSFTDHMVDDAALSAMREGAETDLARNQAVRDALRLSRQAEARALLGAYEIGLSTYNERIGSGPYTSNKTLAAARRAATGEISMQLGFSRTKATQWSNLGEMLQDLPKIRLAYLAGDFSTHRMAEMVRAAQVAPKGDLRERINEIIDEAFGPSPKPNPDDQTPEPTEAEPTESGSDTEPDTGSGTTETPIDFEDVALDLGHRPTTDTVLRDELDDAVITLDPDGYAEARKDTAQMLQNVTFSKAAFGHMDMSASISAEHGVFVSQRIADMIATRVCRRDPRRIGEQRATALAEIHGVPGEELRCECGFDTCPMRQDTDTDAPAPAASTTADSATDESTPHSSTPAEQDAEVAGEPREQRDDRESGDSSRAEMRGPDGVDPRHDDTVGPQPPTGEPAGHGPDRDSAPISQPATSADSGASAASTADVFDQDISSSGITVIDLIGTGPDVAEFLATSTITFQPPAQPRTGRMYRYRDRRCRNP